MFVPPHRPLVGRHQQRRRSPEGLSHHPNRRHRTAHRHHHLVLRLRAFLRYRPHQLSGAIGWNQTEPAPRVGVLSFRRGHRQVRPVPAPHLVARCDGRSDSGVVADPRGHDGRGRRVPVRPPLRCVLQGLLHRRRRHEPRCVDRLDHDRHGGVACVRADRHKEGSRLLNGLAARLHGHGPVGRRLGWCDLSSLHPRVLQSPALPGCRLRLALG